MFWTRNFLLCVLPIQCVAVDLLQPGNRIQDYKGLPDPLVCFTRQERAEILGLDSTRKDRLHVLAIVSATWLMFALLAQVRSTSQWRSATM